MDAISQTTSIFKCIFLNENVWIPIKIPMKFVSKGPIDNIPALVQIMAWRRSDDNPLSEPMMVIGIDRNTVCAGVVVTAIRHSTGCAGRRATACCAGRRAAAPAGTTSAVPDCSTNHDSADRISGQFLFYHDHNFTKSKGNLRFRRIAPPFVPIGVCVTTHDDGTASDVTIGMWRHNHKATNHERNGRPWFSLPK